MTHPGVGDDKDDDKVFIGERFQNVNMLESGDKSPHHSGTFKALNTIVRRKYKWFGSLFNVNAAFLTCILL